MGISWRGIRLFCGLAIYPMSTALAEAPPCYRELELNFFKPDLVSEALSLHSVYQSSWTLINQELQRRVKLVPELVQQRAKMMDPNPLGTPFQPKEASELLSQVLHEIFSETLALFLVTNQNKVEEMFRYIRDKQSHRFLSCFGEEGLPK